MVGMEIEFMPRLKKKINTLQKEDKMEYKVVLKEEDIRRLLLRAFESEGDIDIFWKIEEGEGIMQPSENLVLTLVSNKLIEHQLYF